MKRKEAKRRSVDMIQQIKEWQKDPEFIRAAYEFVRLHTGHSPR